MLKHFQLITDIKSLKLVQLMPSESVLVEKVKDYQQIIDVNRQSVSTLFSSDVYQMKGASS